MPRRQVCRYRGAGSACRRVRVSTEGLDPWTPLTCERTVGDREGHWLEEWPSTQDDERLTWRKGKGKVLLLGEARAWGRFCVGDAAGESLELALFQPKGEHVMLSAAQQEHALGQMGSLPFHVRAGQARHRPGFP